MMPKRVVLATTNPGKGAELRALVGEWGVEVLTPPAAAAGVAETGATYAENAALKARAVASRTGLPALADDSGLEVEALHGAPGLHSARWAGPEATDEDRRRRLLEALAGVSGDRRAARFRCVAALAWPDGRLESAEGEVGGHIAEQGAGSGGFGYDPIFVASELGCTFAAASAADKRRVSHRARAIRALGARLRAS